MFQKLYPPKLTNFVLLKLFLSVLNDFVRFHRSLQDLKIGALLLKHYEIKNKKDKNGDFSCWLSPLKECNTPFFPSILIV